MGIHKRRHPGRMVGRRRWLRPAIITVVVLNLLVNPLLARYRSLLVMYGYDLYFAAGSVSRATGVEVKLPMADVGLYPLQITFNENAGMSEWLGREVRFSVDYTFADFGYFGSHSGIYDPADPLYSAYVGSYFVTGMGAAPTPEQVSRIAEFDQRRLALPALGLAFDRSRFEVNRSSVSSTDFAGLRWTTHDASVTTNCPDHAAERFLGSYIQFGLPPATDRRYPICELQARIEVTYLPADDLVIGLYILAADQTRVDELSDRVVRRAEITGR